MAPVIVPALTAVAVALIGFAGVVVSNRRGRAATPAVDEGAERAAAARESALVAALLDALVEERRQHRTAD